MNTSSNEVCKQKRLDCFAYHEGNCTCLRNTNFGRRTCPFYKEKRNKKKETIA